MRGALVLLAACGRVGFDAIAITPTPTADAPVSAACLGRSFANPAASSFADDFSGGNFTSLWMPVDACIDEIGGELVATPPPSGRFCHAYTVGVWHLTCDAVTMHVPEVTSPVLGVQTLIYFLDPQASQQTIALLLEAGGFALGTDGFAYDSSMAWWRIGEDGGNLYFDTSSDGATWTRRGAIPTPSSMDNIQIAIGAGTYKQVASPGRARFHCYNVPPPCN